MNSFDGTDIHNPRCSHRANNDRFSRRTPPASSARGAIFDTCLFEEGSSQSSYIYLSFRYLGLR